VTIIAQVPSATYPAGQRSFNFSVAAAAAEYRVHLTRDGWIDGVVVSAELWWDGSFAAGVSFTTTAIALDRQGQPMTELYLQTRKPDGATSGSLKVSLSGSLRTAIMVESL
jgi:hypothetical protein